ADLDLKFDEALLAVKHMRRPAIVFSGPSGDPRPGGMFSALCLPVYTLKAEFGRSLSAALTDASFCSYCGDTSNYSYSVYVFWRLSQTMSLVLSSLGALYTALGVFAAMLVPLALLAASSRRRANVALPLAAAT